MNKKSKLFSILQIAGYFGLILFLSCKGSKNIIFDKVKLPEKGEFIFISGEIAESEDDAINSNIAPLIIFPDQNKIFSLDLINRNSRENLSDFIISYREFLIFRDNTKFTLLPEKEKKTYSGRYIPYPLPVMDTSKSRFIYPEGNQTMGIFDLSGNLKSTIDINTLAHSASSGWLDDNTIFFLDDFDLKTNLTRKTDHSIFKININSKKKELIYKSGIMHITNLAISHDKRFLAVAEYNDSATVNHKYTVKIIDLTDGKEKSKKENFNHIKMLKWSPDGILGICHELTEAHTYSIRILSPDGNIDYDLLNLPIVKENPGFFYGDGYLGVVDFAWSPDGRRIAYLASTPGDCYIADEGGNVHCLLDIFMIDLKNKKLNRITEIKREKLNLIQWHQINPPGQSK